MTANAALILAGGAGTRLWPLSTDDRPKQFLSIFGGESLLQKTWARLNQLVPAGKIFVATNDRYRDLVAGQLPSMPEENILLEPARRNTAPAIAVCCLTIEQRFPGSTVGIFPSDQMIGREAEFLDLLRTAFDFAGRTSSLITIGIRPTGPETGFGYLELGEQLEERVVRLRRFVEKPDRARAEEFVASGRYDWNGGMFIWSNTAFEEELRRSAPEIALGSRAFVAAEESDQRRAIYEAMPSISIDFAVMEKAANVAAVRGDFGWSDVGSWNAVFEIIGSGDALHALRSAGSAALDTSGRPVAIVGLPDVAVVSSERGILVINLNDPEGLSELVKTIEQASR
jgi:mannose-1-phosphate guanylyltransferase